MKIRVRVAAVIIKNNKILLAEHQKEGSSYWLLPGGGVEPGETLAQALVREIDEETSLKVKPQELLFVSESINKNDRHVLHLNFRCEILEGDLKVQPDHRLKDARYFEIAELDKIELRPNVGPLLKSIIEGEELDSTYQGNLWH